jgi:uncharacterized protein YhfF
MWMEFVGSSSPAAKAAVGASYSAWQFGYGAQMADELLSLVLIGRKRATTGALRSYELEGEPLPCPGDFSVITDGRGIARCIIRTTAIDIRPFDEVDAAYARDEGEGDLSLEYWREGHWKYYSHELEQLGGGSPELSMPVVCEHFEVVHPPAYADKA